MPTPADNNLSPLPLLMGALLLVISGVFAAAMVYFKIKYAETRASLDKLMKSFHELDEQAKLIIKTDLELNKAQEELDQRLNGLNALQQTSRLVSTTLIENEIFQRLNQPLLTELGFEKYLIIVWNAVQEPVCRINWDFSNEAAKDILKSIQQNPRLLNTLKENHPVSSDEVRQGKEPLIEIPILKQFVIVPILTQTNLLGLLLAGGVSKQFAMTEGDKELISILADQIGQALRNARLFEEIYMSRQNLELKVTERTKEVTTALEEVQKINKMKSEFISAVSHELRTPLTSIKGYASILMTGKVGAVPPEVGERLEKINKHSDSLVKMINDLLDIARIESGRAVMQFAENPLPPVIANVKDILTPQMREKDIVFAAEVAEDLPPVFMDATQMERVLINLVGNAVKFTPQRGSITVRAEHDAGKVTVSVSDSGIGIKEEDLARLFEEFYRADNPINQNVKGTGLGLSLARKIVEAHQGKIWVASKPGEGTTFFFTLPPPPKKS